MTYSYISQSVITKASNFAHLSEQDKNHEENVWMAILKEPQTIEYANAIFRENFDLAIKGLFISKGDTYNYLSPDLQANPEVALLAFKLDWANVHDLKPELFTLEFSKSLLKSLIYTINLKEIISEPESIPQSLREHLDFALNEKTNLFKGDAHASEIVKKISERRPEALLDKNIAADILGKINYCAAHFPQEIVMDDEFMRPLILKHPLLINYASLEMAKDRELLLQMMDNLAPSSTFILEDWDPKFLDDKEIALNALKHSLYSYEKLSEVLKCDLDILCAAWHRANPSPRHVHKNFLLSSVPEEINQIICKNSKEIMDYVKKQHNGILDKMLAEGLKCHNFPDCFDEFKNYLQIYQDKKILTQTIVCPSQNSIMPANKI